METELALVRAALDVFRARKRLDLELARVRELAAQVLPGTDKIDDEELVRLALAKARLELVKAVKPWA